MKAVSKNVIDKKDDTVPTLLKNKNGADIFYRNLQDKFSAHKVDDDTYVKIISDVYDILHKEGIVDWYKNVEVKRIMINKIDDYLYDEVKGKMGIDLSSEEMQEIIEITMRLAENNNDIFKS